MAEASVVLQEEVQLGYELAKEAETRLGYGLRYAYVDGTSQYGGSSLVFSNGTGLYAVVDIKYLPEFRYACPVLLEGKCLAPRHCMCVGLVFPQPGMHSWC